MLKHLKQVQPKTRHVKADWGGGVSRHANSAANYGNQRCCHDLFLAVISEHFLINYQDNDTADILKLIFEV